MVQKCPVDENIPSVEYDGDSDLPTSTLVVFCAHREILETHQPSLQYVASKRYDEEAAVNTGTYKTIWPFETILPGAFQGKSLEQPINIFSALRNADN